MGESFVQSTHNEAAHTSMPVVSVVVEDEDEPPSSGLRHERSSEMKPEANHLPTPPSPAKVVDVEVRSKDYINHQTGSVFNEKTAIVVDPDVKDVKNGADVEKVEPIVTQRELRKRYRVLKLTRAEKLRALFTPRHPIGPIPTYKQSVINVVKYSPLNVLLVFIPVSWALHFTHQSATLVFIFSCLGIVPLAALLGLGTEQIALRTSQSVGGLLNASLGNLIEMIISGIALKNCDLDVVQSALLGGLLSNLLLVLGCAFIVGGFRFHQQEFQPMVAQLNSSLLIVSVISLTIPAAFHQYLESHLPQGSEANILVTLSRISAVILILIYVAYLVFQFYSHNHLFLDTIQEYDSSTRTHSPSSSISRRSTDTLPLPATAEEGMVGRELYRSDTETSMSTNSSRSSHHEVARLNTPAALILLVIVTVLAYITAEHLIESLHGLIDSHPSISKEWITLIVIPIIGNAAEHTTAVIVASKGKFDLAMSVAVGSCIQISLFVIPILVCVAWGMGKPLTLLFDPLETIVLFLSVLVVKFSVEDGKSHWMSGIVLISTYVLIAVSFWYFPNNLARTIQGQELVCVK